MAMLDRDMNYLAVSARWVQNYCRGHADLVGLNHYAVLADMPEWWKGVHRKCLGGATLKAEEDLWVHTDGSKTWVRWTVQPWFDGDGAVAGIVISVEDISDRKRAEEELRESEQRYSAIFHNAPVGIVLLRMPEGIVVSVNEALLSLAGCKRAELVGTTGAGLWVADPEGAAHAWAELEARGCVRSRECACTLRGGNRLVVSLDMDWVTVGGVEHLLVTVQDVTERKRAEETARLYERTKELAQLREEWASIVAHDLQQPISTILLRTEAMLRGDVPGEHRANVENIRVAAGRISRMVHDLMDASQLEARRMSLALDRVDIAALVRDVVERDPDTAACTRVRAPRDRPLVVQVDAVRLEQVLVNLLSNARKYGEAGAEVQVDVEPSDGRARISVTNRGPGIPADELPQLFERYVRAREARASATRGSGLGLYIAKGLVEAHGGRIWAESVPGESTTFHFCIPLEGR
jgi:PAS domain S-box-containing protein